MPKAKADQVVTHRIELQETERATLEAFLIGKTLTNAMSAIAVGAAPLLAAAGAWYLANFTVEEIQEAIASITEAPYDFYASEGLEVYAAYVAVFRLYGWDDFETEAGRAQVRQSVTEVFESNLPPVPLSPISAPSRARRVSALTIVYNRAISFVNQFSNAASLEAARNQTSSVAQMFVEFYPEEEARNDLYYQRTRRVGGFVTLARELWGKLTD